MGGAAQCWGHWNSGGRCSSMDFSGITDVYSTDRAFMALNKNTGAAQCWGDPVYGGSCSSMDFSGVTEVYSTGDAFMAEADSTSFAHALGALSSLNLVILIVSS